MGLFIHLYVNGHNITPEQWEAVYQESLVLLKRFPVPLMRLQIEEIREQKRYVYTTDLINEVHTEDEHWRISGDLSSYRHAEPFIVYRKLEKQLANRERFYAKDVLWADEDSLEYVDGNGMDIFGSKTQGYPYHLAVLAVGILFESRFPDNCYLFGDIDWHQVEQMMIWSKTILKKPVTTPICLDGKRLYTRLSTLYPDPALAIRRFETLFRGTREEALEILLQYADRTAVLKEFRKNVGYYASLSQLGAIRLLSRFLTVTQDVRQLIDMVLEIAEIEKKQKDFTLEALLEVLCNHFITIDVHAREPLSLFAHSYEHLTTIEDTFAQVFLTLSGTPSSIEFYIPPSELLEVCSSYNPAKRDVFKTIIEECEKRCREELEKTEELLREIETEMTTRSTQERNGTTAQEMVGQEHAAALSHADISPEEEYIIAQTFVQQRTYKEPEESAKRIGAQLQKIIHEHPELFRSVEKAYYLDRIYQASYQNGFALRKSAWEAIDHEENLNILNALLAFSIIKENEIHFWHWRIYMLEHLELWKYLVNKKMELP